jgi:hypothetical protein
MGTKPAGLISARRRGDKLYNSLLGLGQERGLLVYHVRIGGAVNGVTANVATLVYQVELGTMCFR